MKRYLIILLALATLVVGATAIVSQMTINTNVNYGCGVHGDVYIRAIVDGGPVNTPIKVVNNKASFQVVGGPKNAKITFVATSGSWQGEIPCKIYVNNQLKSFITYTPQKTLNNVRLQIGIRR